MAAIAWNGDTIGRSCNQFTRLVCPVAFQQEINSLQIEFTSPSVYADAQAAAYPYSVPDGFAPEQFGERNRNFIRKEQCSFSWDWGPCMLPIGIWKDIYLYPISRESAWISDVTADISKEGSEFVMNVSIVLGNPFHISHLSRSPYTMKHTNVTLTLSL